MYYLNTVFLNSIVALKLYSKIEERAFFLLLPKKKIKMQLILEVSLKWNVGLEPH